MRNYFIAVLAIIWFAACNTGDDGAETSRQNMTDSGSIDLERGGRLYIEDVAWNQEVDAWQFHASIRNTTTKAIRVTIDGDTSRLPVINFIPNYMTVEIRDGDIWKNITRPSDAIPLAHEIQPGDEVQLDILISPGHLKEDLQTGDVIRITYAFYLSDPIRIPAKSSN